MMDLLKLLNWIDNKFYECIICGYPKETHTHNNFQGGPCPLMTTIDALRSGSLVVLERREPTSNILEWFASGRVGDSSKFMASIAAGLPIPMFDPYPHDPSDFNRCLLLLKKAPEVKGAFKKIAERGPVWRKFIAEWDDLEEQFIDEAGLDWCKSKSAPKTYAMMMRIIDSGKTN